MRNVVVTFCETWFSAAIAMREKKDFRERKLEIEREWGQTDEK